jgi:SAM-dependent methyltransferase
MRLEPASRTDRWLEPWLPLVTERAGVGPVLELGCGSGKDTAVLASAGLHVVAIDASAEAVAAAKDAVPDATFLCRDIRAPFPACLAEVGAVIASLSLHYFSWPETAGLVERIRSCMRHGGVLLCRLNSTRDHNYGASGYPVISEGYFLVEGSPKRFFDERNVADLFATGWRTLSCREQVIDRDALPKAVWEVVVERDT